MTAASETRSTGETGDVAFLLESLFDGAAVAIGNLQGHRVSANRAFFDLYRLLPPGTPSLILPDLATFDGADAGTWQCIRTSVPGERGIEVIELEVTIIPLQRRDGSEGHVALCYREASSSARAAASELPAPAPSEPDQPRDSALHARHLVRILDDTLDLAKLESGTRALACKPTDVRRPILNAVSLLHAQLGAKQQQVDLRSDPTLASRSIDADRLQRALYHLLVAVSVAAEVGSVIEIRTRGDDEGMRLEIEARRGQAGDRSSAESQPSRVLELTLARRLIELLGGALERDARHARHTVRLP